MKGINLYDAAPTAAISFLQQQAAFVESEIYRVEYPQYKSNVLLDIDSSAPDWSKTVIFRAVDGSGKLKWMGENSTDVPTVDIAQSQGFHKIKTAALGYTYTLEELNYASLAGENLDAERAMVVRDTVEQGLNQIYLLGDTEAGYEGLFNGASVPKTTAATTIAAAIAAKTPEAIIKIFGDAYTAVYSTQTNTIHKPTVFAMPTDQYLALMQNFCNFGNASNISYLQALKIAFPDMTFEDDINLKAAGASSKDRLVTYKKDIRVVKGHEPMGLRFMAPPTADNINFKIPAMVRSGGTEWRIPKAAHYTDGI